MDDDDVCHPFYFAVQDDTVDEELLMSLSFLLPPPAPEAEAVQQAVQESAFSAYQSAAASASSSAESLRRRYRSAPGNLHRRMHEYLRSIDDDARGARAAAEMPQAVAGEPAVQQQAAPGGGGGSARFRHIMRERVRRERLSQGYADLEAVLPGGASKKGGKNFIVGAAANYIRHLEGKKEWLRARNEELGLAPPPPARPGAVMVVKVRAESELGPMVDVFEAVLRRLKAMEELQVTAIQSCLCDGGMWMDVAVESKISSREVDKAIRNALRELQEIGPGSCLQIGSKTSFSCQVESGVLLTS
ncbi:transcription factor BHLH148-like [Oryza brachyantha]|uniref:transcription factor BHLH148-like n=1 Tax=Oryza brachyantha TaxID=4533 RepID=UPI001ADBDEAC|nr:transcription factor BHLH148-like [Oryza brachyantha]